MSEEENQDQGLDPNLENEPADKGNDLNVPIADIEEAAAAQGWSPDKGELGALEFLSHGREFRDRLYNKVDKLERENTKVYDLVAQQITKQDVKDHKAVFNSPPIVICLK